MLDKEICSILESMEPTKELSTDVAIPLDLSQQKYHLKSIEPLPNEMIPLDLSIEQEDIGITPYDIEILKEVADEFIKGNQNPKR